MAEKTVEKTAKHTDENMKPRTRSTPPFPFGPLSALLISSILLSLQSCLNYPARMDFGPGLEEYHTNSQARKQEAPFAPAKTLISSQLIMELSHNQLQALDSKDRYSGLRRYPVQVYRISYRSKNFTPLSALILLPVGIDIVEYNVLSYHHATLMPFPYKRLGAYEAPSFFGSRYRKTKDFFAVTNYGLPAASSGYLTVLPDYMGYGLQAGSEHPFMIGPELGQESMDALRAVYQWAKEKALPLSSRLYLSGTSEGAYAAIWTQRFIESAADFQNIQVEGAYYAGPYNISALFKKLSFDTDQVHPLFNWALYSIWYYFLRNGNQRQQQLAQYFQAQQYQQLAASTKSWQKSNIWLRKVPNVVSILLQKPMPKEKLFQRSFVEQINNQNSDFWVLANLLNIHEDWQAKGPIHLYHNSQDPLIPLSNSKDALAKLQASGSQVTLQFFERKDHTGGHLRYLRKSLAEFSQSSGLYVPPYEPDQTQAQSP